MQRGAGRRAAGEDEAPQRRQLGLEPIDQLLEPRDVVVAERAPSSRGRRACRAGSASWAPSANRSRWMRSTQLRRAPDRVARRAREAEPGVQLVDLAVRVDARVVLRDARAVEERRLAGVAGARVDFHGRELYEMPRSMTPATQRARTPLAALPRAAPIAGRFRQRLLTWYRRHGRDLPWRKTDDPYHILVSEIMLQQTQVDRVLPKYAEWLEKYPSLEALADGARARGDADRGIRSATTSGRKRLQTIAREAVAQLRRPAAGRRGDAAVVQGHRRLHRRRDPQLRVPASARPFSTPTSRACCSASSSARAIRRATR